MKSSPLFVVLLAASADAHFDRRQKDAEPLTFGGNKYSCKCYPDSKCWPSISAWSRLNSTVGGNLISVTPFGNACYKSFEGKTTYDAAKCAAAQTNNANPIFVSDDPAQIMWPYYANNTCDPLPGQENNECSIGYYPEYVIVAKTRQHIQAGVNFARDNNLRLVIRNTGHDMMGRSTGKGSLSINTHSFKDIKFIDKYTGPGDWKGGAVQLGAGVQFYELYPKAFQKKVLVVGGECPTVGISGGYIQGGGQSPLSGMFGLAVDNALSFDVVLADGSFVTANAKQNTDLFWALRGGGPSTFGVVTGMTVKTHPEMPSIGMTLIVATTGEPYWKAFSAFHKSANHFANKGLYVWFAAVTGFLQLQPFVALNMTRPEFEEIVTPFLNQLRADNVPFTHEIREFPTFYELYDTMWEKTHDRSGGQTLLSGRIYAQQDVAEHGDEIVAAVRSILDAGGIYGGHILNPGYRVPKSDTPAHPVWRKAAAQDIIILNVKENPTLEERRAAENTLTNVFGKVVREASPRSASYVNEGDVNEPNWQDTYWGENYPRLLRLKKRFDPLGVLYAKTTPGTENWVELDGKLCRRV